ncbi:MAG: phospholipase D family protein [Firmicutes bacterium]|nr:phospholipase D family protein [Bacillota bacterium]
MTLSRALKVVLYIAAIYAVYALVAGVIIFGFHQPAVNQPTEYVSARFFSEETGPDRVVLVEGRSQSAQARVNLIEKAQHTLDITYHAVHAGESADLFFGCIFAAADRGVQVRLLLDGLFHSLRGTNKDLLYAVIDHPNIELRLYEPLNLLQPWTANNRLHDKLLVVDKQLAMTGGRNIGDKYFLEDFDGEPVHDRDVVIVNTDMDVPTQSVVSQIGDYFDEVWEHEFTSMPSQDLTGRQRRRGQERIEELRRFVAEQRRAQPELFKPANNWLEDSVPTNKITLIHNPLQRLNKEPWVWQELAGLLVGAEESIYMQSPYVIPGGQMMRCLDVEQISAEDINILTNSVATSPNPFAMSGYTRYRPWLVDVGINLYEYQGPGSVHAKSYVFDSRLSLVGSFNIDPRSAFLSTETMVVIDSEEFAAILEEQIKHLVAEGSLAVGPDYGYQDSSAVEARPVSRFKRLLVRILSWITYPFEYML